MREVSWHSLYRVLILSCMLERIMILKTRVMSCPWMTAAVNLRLRTWQNPWDHDGGNTVSSEPCGRFYD